MYPLYGYAGFSDVAENITSVAYKGVGQSMVEVGGGFKLPFRCCVQRSCQYSPNQTTRQSTV